MIRLSRSQERALGFKPQPMVTWMRPRELVRSGIRALLAAVFGAYADRRELQAALDPSYKPIDYSDRDELWIDYVADTGDGFDSTYTVARAVSEDQLAFGDGAQVTARGEILILGGDQVYPTASHHEYRARFRKPYEDALPGSGRRGVGVKGDVFAIPGNHDWYDGLTSFLRQFCQEWEIGARRTRQKRSYFALRLPHGWWLWGVDMQLNADIDPPQTEFFKRIARDKKLMPPGSKVVLAVAEPLWLAAADDRGASVRMASWFIKRHIYQYGHKLPAVLAGDLHCYARWEDQRPIDGVTTQWFMCGGGGAYLYPTHHLPGFRAGDAPDRPSIHVQLQRDGPHGETTETHGLVARKAYPSVEKSRRLAVGALAFPAMGFGNLLFGWLLGGIYLLLAWFLTLAGGDMPDPAGKHEQSWLGVVAELIGRAFTQSPFAFLLLVVLGLGLIAWANFPKPWMRWIAGTLHAVVHVLLAVAVSGMALTVNCKAFHLERESAWSMLLFAAEVVLIGGLVGAFVVGFYLWISNLFGGHANEVFVCQSLPHSKSFLRFHIDADGCFRVYAIGIEEVETNWTARPQAVAPDHKFEPKGGPIAGRTHLIEGPLELNA